MAAVNADATPKNPSTSATTAGIAPIANGSILAKPVDTEKAFSAALYVNRSTKTLINPHRLTNNMRYIYLPIMAKPAPPITDKRIITGPIKNVNISKTEIIGII